MPGKILCTVQKETPEVHEFSNITLTYISGERLAVVSRNGEEPREILALSGARVDILSSGEIEVNGFLRRKGEKNQFRKCKLVFRGNATQKEAS